MGHNHQQHAAGIQIEEARIDLGKRLDDLRGLGLLPAWSDSMEVEGEAPLLKLSLSLVDLLELAQRRVIETSIQLLSLRELVAALLNMHTPNAVAKTVALYLHKAFDHERVLVGIRTGEDLTGWIAVRRGSPRYADFELTGHWNGALRAALHQEAPIRARGDKEPMLEGNDLPQVLEPFAKQGNTPYLVYPLLGSGQKVLGVLAVMGTKGHANIDAVDADILQSLVEAVSTALENVLLDESVRRQEAFRKDILGSMASGLLAVDLSQNILTANPRACLLSGRSTDELEGSTPKLLGSEGNCIHRLLQETIRTGEAIGRAESYVEQPNGNRIPVACSTALLNNPQKEIYGAMVTFEDLSTIKAMEERIRQLDRLAALGRFTSGVAHEIRNPLAGIAAGVQYLAKHFEDSPEQEENLTFMNREIHRLDRIVEDLFRVTHPLPPRKVAEKPKQLLELSQRSLGTRAQDKSIQIMVECAANVPPVPVDADQIQQVLINLLKNAIEATPPQGTITASAFVSEKNGAGPCIVFEIRDNGPGIDDADLPHIFEPFFTKGKAEGTGLGLYVSHGIAERHGGELLAANAPDGGAVFSLRIPLTCYNTMEMAG